MGKTDVSVNEPSVTGRRSWNVTKMLTTSGSIIQGPCLLGGLIVQPDGTNAVTMTIYDSLTATGKRLPPNSLSIAATAGLWSLSFGDGVDISVGVYVGVRVAGGGKAKYWLVYDE